MKDPWDRRAPATAGSVARANGRLRRDHGEAAAGARTRIVREGCAASRSVARVAPEMEVTVIRGAFSWARSFVALVPLVLACSGSQQNVDSPSGETGTGAETSAGEATSTGEDTAGGASSPPPASGAGGLNKEQTEQMELVLKRGSKKAEQCSESVPDGKGGAGEVKVLFDGQKGRITEVTVGPPWAGTSMEACIKRSFVGEIILPFEGDPLEVPYDIKIPEKQGAAADPKAGKKP